MLKKLRIQTRTIPGLFRAMRRLGYYKTKTPKNKIKSGKMEKRRDNFLSGVREHFKKIWIPNMRSKIDTQ